MKWGKFLLLTLHLYPSVYEFNVSNKNDFVHNQDFDSEVWRRAGWGFHLVWSWSFSPSRLSLSLYDVTVYFLGLLAVPLTELGGQ